MKDIYGKLREEHVNLIRKEADGKKQLNAEKLKQEEFKQAKLVSAHSVQTIEKSIIDYHCNKAVEIRKFQHVQTVD